MIERLARKLKNYVGVDRASKTVIHLSLDGTVALSVDENVLFAGTVEEAIAFINEQRTQPTEEPKKKRKTVTEDKVTG